jgi:hypothetical protein
MIYEIRVAVRCLSSVAFIKPIGCRMFPSFEGKYALTYLNTLRIFFLVFVVIKLKLIVLTFIKLKEKEKKATAYLIRYAVVTT